MIARVSLEEFLEKIGEEYAQKLDRDLDAVKEAFDWMDKQTESLDLELRLSVLGVQIFNLKGGQ